MHFVETVLENVLQASGNFYIWRPLRIPLKCPNCRSIIEIASTGIESLPVNFALRAIIEKYQQEDHPDVVTCPEHYRQPLNVYCLLDKKLVCGHCLTIGQHHGHPIDDLQSAYLKEKDILSVFHYVPLHSAPAGIKFGRFHGEDRYTTKESERILRLPMFYTLTADQVEYITDQVKAFYDLI